MSDPRYPIGKFAYDGPPTEKQRDSMIEILEQAPAALRRAVTGLSPEQLDTPYRDGGWTVQQVVHHLADSHMNAYVRFKLALTEDEPTVKTYAEARWAELPDNQSTSAESSVVLFESLHERWVHLLRGLSAEQWKRSFRHPELGLVPLEKSLALYAWHSRHHVAHITELKKKNGW